MSKLHYITGVNIPIPVLKQELHQPTIKEIALMGEEYCFSCVSVFKMSDGKQLSQKVKQEKGLNMEFSDFEAFMQLVLTEGNLNKQIESFFFLLFPTLSKIVWTESTFSMQFNNTKKAIVMTPSIFQEIKNVILIMFCLDGKSQSEEFNPINDRAAKIAEKLKRHRERIAKQNQNMQEDVDDNDDFLSNMISCFSAVGQIPVTDILNYTYYQLIQQFRRSMMLKSATDQIRMSVMGGLKSEDVIDWQKPL